ncbi:non-ribosomal peptide synthetase [Oscillatoria acuminata]|uniref:Amino acid adenylation enzyme/thioester reductase family protein n=1 Tax=Oscillatoria acuminata PCC 6304 TaxID=56110 RepID=K9TL11_9CYAN|nr:non-ribosomal peptide synthetase [Oscillatoria acuminata]AFY82811.1 amino acid adenylation enzyme/thioester reductase family protein [Oscillatoria acuminata PCC 6304]
MINEIEGFRLSPQQKQVWQLQQLDNFAYCCQGMVQIAGKCDSGILKTAIGTVIQRHEILRTTFPCLPGMTLPVQAITTGEFQWHDPLDLSSCLPEDRDSKLAAYIQEIGQQPFNWEQGPLFHAAWVSLGVEQSVLIIRLPAVCADAQSLENLGSEIATTYRAICQGETLSDEPLQYADLAEWQNQLLESPETEIGANYWRQLEVAGLGTLKLPGELEGNSSRFQPQDYAVKLSGELTEKIAQFADNYEVKTQTVLLTAWLGLIQRFTGQETFTIGVLAEGRKYAELSTAIGAFAKVLPLNYSAGESATFAGILPVVHQAVAEGEKWQEYFTWETLSGLPPETAPFFPLAFEGRSKAQTYGDSQLSLTCDRPWWVGSRFKLKLSVQPDKEGLILVFDYDTNAFQIETIQRFGNQLICLLESIIATPEKPLSQLNLLTETERHQLLVQFNATHRDYNGYETIHQFIEERATATPDKIALIFSQETLTYGELNARANQLAGYLQQLGVNSQDLVGLYLERSLEMVVAILGILKAGAAYVPLDPAYPKERLGFMLENAQPSVLLTQASLTAELSEIPAKIVCLDSDRDAIAAQSAENATTPGGEIAYIIYTSGSTGKPKGVKISHRNLCHYVQAMGHALGIQRDDIYLHTASIAFSSSVRQLMVPLAAGATVNIATSQQRQDPLALFQEVKDRNVTVIDIVPSFWRNSTYALSHLEAQGRSHLLVNNLRLIVSASEPLRSDLPQIWRQEFQHPAQFINMFGQTETCGIVATYPIPDTLSEGIQIVPLGRAIANTQLYILDEFQQPVPIGVTGELYVGGWGVGQGYLNRPELTAEKFIPDPYHPDGKLYKTGDLTRYLPDGTIEFVGRRDYQVKIRGFRIELGEIESVLSEHPAVRDAVVVAREEGGEKRLVAYVTSDRPGELGRELRQFASQRLPDYMIPSTFAVLDSFPLTPNGKVNRQALPTPEELQGQSEAIAPRTPVEELLAGIWAQLLQRHPISREDNFFEVGGHSLLVTQLVSQIRDTFGVELPLRSLFETPTLAQLADCIETSLAAGEKLDIPEIVPVSKTGAVPLSFSQERLWFLEGLEPGTYNSAAAVRLQGQVNIPALEESFNEIARRHDTLRTRFVEGEGCVIQEIMPEVRITLPVISCEESQVPSLAVAWVQQPFDLTQPPLVRLTLFQLQPDEFILLFVIHHIVSDGWSMGVLIQELGTIYGAYSTGRISPLPALAVQYADFVLWQRQWLNQARLGAQMDYWKRQLGGDLPGLDLPTDYPRPGVQSFRGATQSLTLPIELSEALNTLSQQSGVTLYMTLLAAFQTLLYRYSGQSDIRVGTPIANRNRGEIEGLIGCFVNTLVLRTDLSGTPSFRELMGRVREVALGAYAHQDLPFEQLVEALQPSRTLSHSPIFQVMFVLQNAPMAELELPGLRLNLLELDSKKSRFDLTLAIAQTRQGLLATLEYSTDLFEAGTISRMLGHFQTLLESAVAGPDARISEMPMLTANEQAQLLHQWNDTAAEYPETACIHELIEAQVAKTPDAVAAVFEGQSLTYQELSDRASQLAQYLQSIGVQRNQAVALYVDRSLEMLVGLLGILKSGAAYLPLDPALPGDRLQYMLEHSQAGVILTQQHLISTLPSHQARVVCLDAMNPHPGRVGLYEQSPPARAEDLAYIIYTSGSTGRPKGVQLRHRSVVNFLTSMKREPGITCGDRLLAVTTLIFDIAALELFLPLTVGACVIIASREVATDGQQLASLLDSQQITVMQATPSTWRMLIESGWQGRPQLKILCGGEALPRLLADELCNRAGSVWNLYGPTETTIWSTLYPVTPGEETVSIGRAVANTQIYLLDQALQPVPVGIPGDLYIGGAGLAAGYLHQPELTSEKFIPSPFAENPEVKLYKTGDVARYRPDGTLEYIGRVDNQVKIRGFRIELGEIESVLAKNPEVRQGVVIAREDTPGDTWLVAYVVLHPQAEPNSSQWRQLLKQQLPDYMIPAAFVVLDTLPLTPNGKIDRKALPAPSRQGKEAHIAPATPLEQQLTEIWAQVLGLEQVGVEENFFELGGHSLLATQLISRIPHTFQVELPLRSLFESPTVREFASRISGATVTASFPLMPVSRNQNLPLSFAQQRLWFLEQLEPGTATYNIPAVLRLTGNLDEAALEASLNAVIDRHEALRTSFPAIDGQPIQAIAPQLRVNIVTLDLSEVASEDWEAEGVKTAVAESLKPFDLEQLPLLRVTLIQHEGDRLLVLVLHHIIADGWSMGVLIREIATLYDAFSTGKSVALPELPIQYADFAVWQRHVLQGEILEHKLAYWKQQLGGTLPVLNLPGSRSQLPISSRKGATYTFQIPAEVARGVQVLSHQENVTLFMTLLAGFQTLLYRYTQCDDVVVGTDLANRSSLETEGLIGFFINLLVLRTNLSGNPSFRELLTRVKQVTLDAYAHQDVPFEKLVETLRPDRQSTANPLFQVLFVLQNAPMPPLELSGLTLEPVAVDTGIARFDIALFLTETESGIAGKWQYNADKFEEGAIVKFSHHFVTLLSNISTQSDSRLDALDFIPESEREQQAMQKQARKSLKLKTFKAVQAQTVDLSPERLINTEYLTPGETFPLVITPRVSELDAVEWATHNREFIQTQLQQHGGILFRNFGLQTPGNFEQFAQGICPQLFGEYGDLPREGISGKVYGSTPYPADKAILFHNESSHLHCWPLKIWFFCAQPAQEGGETPIVDCRKVYQYLNPQIREKLAQKQLMYVRTFTEGLDVSWQEFFHTDERAVVENYCNQAGIRCQWLPDNGLRTEKIQPAIAKHPQTGEWVFFNQILLHHIGCLDVSVRESLLSLFGENKLPRNVYYGDGSAIEEETIAEIATLYENLAVTFSWQQGDVVMLDNMLAAHSRNPFVGPRKIVVAMGEMVQRADIQFPVMEEAHAQ